MKQSIQHVLKRAGLYQRFRASSVYDLYWTFADRSIVEDRRLEADFYRSLLTGFRPGDLIFDVGANQGSKTSTFLRLGARVVAVDPDEANQQILKEMFLQYRLSPRPVVIVGKALSDKNSVETMFFDEPGSAKNTLSKKWVETLRTDQERFGHSLDFREKKDVETTTLDALMNEYGVPYFVKIDVEGYEPTVLQGLQRPVPFLSFEVNLPEFRPEGVQCIERLEKVAPDGKFNYAVDCRKGLVNREWTDAKEFLSVFQQCNEPSIEVFWKTSAKA